MTIILLLFAALCIAPLTSGLLLMGMRSGPIGRPPILGSILLCALAFNLVFFWQELWLVVTPGPASHTVPQQSRMER